MFLSYETSCLLSEQQPLDGAACCFLLNCTKVVFSAACFWGILVVWQAQRGLLFGCRFLWDVALYPVLYVCKMGVVYDW